MCVRSSDRVLEVPIPVGSNLILPTGDPWPAGFKRKFQPCVESSNNHLTSALTTSFWARIFIPPQPLLHLLLT
jgi:hypothetical protein